MPTDTKSLRNGRKASAVMFLANGFITGSWAPQIPLLLPRHDITETTLGLLILLLGVGAVGAMTMAGAMIARFGARAILRVFATSASLALVAVVLAPNLWILSLAMVLMGALIGSMDVSMNANAVDLEQALGRAIMSSSHGFWSVGGFVGASIGGWAIGQIGAEGHALAVGGVTLAAVLFALPHLIGDAAKPKPDVENALRTGWPRSAGIYILGIMALFSMIPEGAVLDWAALYLQQEHGTGVATAGLAYALFSATMAIMRFVGDPLRNRFGAVQILRVSALVAALGLMGVSLAPNAGLVILCFAFSGLGVANLVPVMFSAAGNYPGLTAGMGIATVTMLGYSGILIAPSAIGFIADTIGFRVTFGALAVILIIVAWMAERAAIADFKSKTA